MDTRPGSPWLQFSLRGMLLAGVCLSLGLGAIMQAGGSYVARRRATFRRMGQYRGALLIKDGQALLLRRGDVFGAFVPVRQSLSPERVQFRWCYRMDKQGRLASDELALRKGVGLSRGPVNNQRARFGPFDVQWSGCQDGWGWVYYARQPGELPHPGDLHLCLLGKEQLADINARERQWIYRSSKGDTGVSGAVSLSDLSAGRTNTSGAHKQLHQTPATERRD